MLKKFMNQVAATAPAGETIDTVLGASTHVKGVLTFEGSVRIDGKFDGEISAGGTLVIGEGSIVNANVRVARVVVAGQVHGDIAATESLEVQPTGRIYGDIQTPELQLSRGVTLEGKCVINRKPDGSLAVNIGEPQSPRAQASGRDGNTLRVAQNVG
ncbi:MAG: hypothetical protein A3G34_09920 [Candidatus Lindowbacteria bacterium RIFCSPLOWO2_12_FULL_62_27]|nr:MAG: hypothetical protein A3G34_09920 [Candidatus Lindowbacteria bacterium RIFCSPLOWO2_12_FULL_62_27]OGH61559.1 MAG: hypothetical protein A3I06_02930 [Candidatus Lindowbacteria bacterium RIFCSPLOWO2_02_FULL_62_12]